MLGVAKDKLIAIDVSSAGGSLRVAPLFAVWFTRAVLCAFFDVLYRAD